MTNNRIYCMNNYVVREKKIIKKLNDYKLSLIRLLNKSLNIN